MWAAITRGKFCQGQGQVAYVTWSQQHELTSARDVRNYNNTVPSTQRVTECADFSSVWEIEVQAHVNMSRQ